MNIQRLVDNKFYLLVFGFFITLFTLYNPAITAFTTVNILIIFIYPFNENGTGGVYQSIKIDFFNRKLSPPI